MNTPTPEQPSSRRESCLRNQLMRGAGLILGLAITASILVSATSAKPTTLDLPTMNDARVSAAAHDAFTSGYLSGQADTAALCEDTVDDSYQEGFDAGEQEGLSQGYERGYSDATHDLQTQALIEDFGTDRLSSEILGFDGIGAIYGHDEKGKTVLVLDLSGYNYAQIVFGDTICQLEDGGTVFLANLNLSEVYTLRLSEKALKEISRNQRVITGINANGDPEYRTIDRIEYVEDLCIETLQESEEESVGKTQSG